MNEAAKPTSQPETPPFRVAVLAEVEPLARLINSAFRVEQPFIEGERTNQDGVRTYMGKGTFLVAEDSAGLVGCVYVENRGDRGYVGLLSVDPPRQGSGLGRTLMVAAEKFLRKAGCRAVDLRVVSARTPLLAFYRHLGYVESGTAPFSPDVPVKVPCHYILMSKDLG